MTTEERLAQLERSQIDTNHHITMLAGVIGSQGQDIKRILTILEEHSAALHEHSTAIRALLAQLPER